MLITIVGCGFIGSHTTEELAKMAFSQDLDQIKFRLIDFDIWEKRNAANQHVSLLDAESAEHKVKTCSRYIRNYNFEVDAIIQKLISTNVQELLEDSDLVIDCLDNIPTRQLLWAMGKGNNPCPVMHTGISRKGEGIINWSSEIFDTFPFRPDLVAGRELKEQDIKELPCEMYKYRSSGLVLVSAIAKAVALYLGKDPWGIMQGAEEPGVMTCWSTSPNKAKLKTEPEYLINDFFPVFSR